MRDFFGVDDGFTRTVPRGALRTDVGLAAALVALSITGLLGYWSIPDFQAEMHLAWSIPLTLLAGAMIAVRRLFPVGVLLLCTGVHFVVLGSLIPLAASQPGMQVLYFLGLYSAMAWARNREALMLATIVVLLAMTVWVSLAFSVFGALRIAEMGASPLLLVISQIFINVAYFGAATWLGRNAWLKARSEAELAASRVIVDHQARQLADQAVLGERLRIARELHDSLAHHVALIGVQTASARRSMDRKPVEAKEALLAAERSARQSVQELRTVLGSLRSGDEDAAAPGLESLPALVEDNATLGMAVHLTVVGDPSQLDSLTPTQSTTLYRVIQEALTNVRTHSTATAARLTVRFGEDLAEAEIIDDGRPLRGTGGSGLGQLGIRERVSALGGTTDIGSRPARGYRVLVRLPVHGRSR
ncbi:sensor histidine kinase [Tessaracoccus antarcticus]|uniref:histidine kinase n=1 Tax=Tessaracoccus antarcticus TaxID=2479848 RepID=A0A3M0GAX9_9ACTN|nr:sensor histidine kinase [Tessaracoccus antarcticus]RMB59642.1 sensor histidine kinase [Tessaracoccus antarcticus]